MIFDIIEISLLLTILYLVNKKKFDLKIKEQTEKVKNILPDKSRVITWEPPKSEQEKATEIALKTLKSAGNNIKKKIWRQKTKK